MQAEKKKLSVEDLTAKIIGAGGPASNSTKAEACKFHDDKSLYTGVFLHHNTLLEPGMLCEASCYHPSSRLYGDLCVSIGE